MDESSDLSASGRRRISAGNRTYSAEDQALNAIAREAENRLAAKRQARAEAREIRMKEIEKTQKEQEGKDATDGTNGKLNEDVFEDKPVTKPALRTQFSTSSYISSRRSSEDSGNDCSSNKDLQEIKEKYKQAMLNNSQLDNEKQTFKYQVDLLKDKIEEHEEEVHELTRQFKEKSREADFQKRTCTDLEREISFLKEELNQRDKLIQENGLVLIGTTGDSLQNETIVNGAALLSAESAKILAGMGDGTLDEKIRKIAEDKTELEEKVSRLTNKLEETRKMLDDKLLNDVGPRQNGPDLKTMESQRNLDRQLNEYKFKLQKQEQEMSSLESSNRRLENQVARYKTAAEEAEALEEQLKTEKRQLSRQLREAQTSLEEAQTQNRHLQNRIDKMKSNRNALLK